MPKSTRLRAGVSTLALFAATGGLAFAHAAAAQSAGDPKSGTSKVDEVVVQARLRSEPLQVVPAAVTAFSAQQIEKSGIDRPADFIGLTPNMSLVQGQDVGTAAIVVRGIGEIRNGETPVAIVIDGVVQSSSLQFNQDLIDIQQIEVLKGPQGALYGRNAIAGAINITTKAPSDTPEGMIKVGGGNGGAWDVGGFVSGPIIKDQLFVRLAASYDHADGWINNTFLNKKVDFHGNGTVNFRLDYRPTDKFSADVRAAYSDTTGGAAYYVRATNRPPGSGPAPTNATQAANTYYDPISNNLGQNKRQLGDFSLKMDYQSPIGTLTSITAYDTVDYSVTFDGYDYSPNTYCINVASGTPSDAADTTFNCAHPMNYFFGAPLAEFNTSFQTYHVRSVSQEFRITSDSSARLRYIAGVYFMNRGKQEVTGNNLDKGLGATADLNFDPSSSNPTTSYFAEQDHDNSYAVFGQLAYDITHELELSGALRYDLDQRYQYDPRPDAYRVDGYGTPLTGARARSASFDDLQPKATLNYKPTSDLTFYGGYSVGFRSGGFNAPGTEVSPFTGEFIAASVYKKETSDNYEIGFKSRWLDRKLTINGALFYSNVSNLQVFNFNGQVNAQVVNNIDKTVTQGGELEAVYHPIHGLDLFAGFGYTDAKIKQYRLHPADVGNQVPLNTPMTSDLGGQYTWSVGDRIEMFGRFEWEHRGKTYFSEGGNAFGIPVRKPLDLFNLRAGITLDGKWKAAVWVKNLTDVRYYEEVVSPDYAYPARPRTFGVELRRDF